jgi:RNA polymerase sigma factor (sigma-70 family)
VALIRRGSTTAFEVLVARYHSRLLAFCRHLLGSREDAEDVLQEVFSAAFNAMLDDDRPINVRPWLYRIARNRSLNHLRRIQAVGVDSMDVHLHDHGATTADKVHEREEFRLLVGDIQTLPETQRTALVLREMDALSYEQIAEAMETTVPSVKSLLVRARVSLAEAAQARMLTCEEVRVELGEVAEGLRRRPGPLVRRHLRTCERCATFKSQLGETSKALAAMLPIGGFALLRKLAILHIGHSAGAGSSASGAGAASAGQAAAVGSTAAAGASALVGSTGGGFLSASVGAVATKAAAGLAAAALVTAGAVEVDQPVRTHAHHHAVASQSAPVPSHAAVASTPAPPPVVVHPVVHRQVAVKKAHKPTPTPAKTTKTTKTTSTAHKATPSVKQTAPATAKTPAKAAKPKAAAPPPGRTQTQTDATVLAQSTTPSVGAAGTAACTNANSSVPVATSTASASTTPPSSDSASTSTGPTTTTTQPGTTTTTSQPSSDAGASTTAASAAPTPASAPAADGSCASDPSGSTSAGSSGPSGGVAP